MMSLTFCSMISGMGSRKFDFSNVVSGFCIDLFDNSVGLRFTEGANSLFEITDVAFGPFNLNTRTS